MTTVDAVLATVLVGLLCWACYSVYWAWRDQDQDFREVEHRNRAMLALARMHKRDTP